MAIQGVHAMFYTTDAEATRDFIRDRLQFPYTDVGDGWLIFDAPAADIGCHPGSKPSHDISFYCKDIEGTKAELEGRGVKFVRPLRDDGWGVTTEFELPGVGPIQLYEPKYPK